MDGAEQECSGYILSSQSGMLGLRWWDGARAEAHGTVGGGVGGGGRSGSGVMDKRSLEL